MFSGAITSVPPARLQKFAKIFRNILHLWKFLVISQVRTNFAEMPGNRNKPGSREQHLQGRRGGESESLEEEAIEIGNS